MSSEIPKCKSGFCGVGLGIGCPDCNGTGLDLAAIRARLVVAESYLRSLVDGDPCETDETIDEIEDYLNSLPTPPEAV